MDKCKTLERVLRDPTSLGNILIAKGWCTKEDVLTAAKQVAHTIDYRIGKTLVEYGVITEEQLRDALFEQRRVRGKVSRLEELAYLSEHRRRQLAGVRKNAVMVAQLSLEVGALVHQFLDKG